MMVVKEDDGAGHHSGQVRPPFTSSPLISAPVNYLHRIGEHGPSTQRSQTFSDAIIFPTASDECMILRDSKLPMAADWVGALDRPEVRSFFAFGTHDTPPQLALARGRADIASLIGRRQTGMLEGPKDAEAICWPWQR
jgi:hypothetical protein